MNLMARSVGGLCPDLWHDLSGFNLGAMIQNKWCQAPAGANIDDRCFCNTTDTATT
jgi:hypothetical protein